MFNLFDTFYKIRVRDRWTKLCHTFSMAPCRKITKKESSVTQNATSSFSIYCRMTKTGHWWQFREHLSGVWQARLCCRMCVDNSGHCRKSTSAVRHHTGHRVPGAGGDPDCVCTESCDHSPCTDMCEQQHHQSPNPGHHRSLVCSLDLLTN